MPLMSVILSGGAGSRLWPVSRQAFPKTFMKIGGSTLFQQAIERGQACGADTTLVVTSQDHLYRARDIFTGIPGACHPHYLLEPTGRNTAPAIALTALACAENHGPDVVMLVLPADHLIPDSTAFFAGALEAIHQAKQGQLVVFGISPTSPDTVFGYIKVGKLSRNTQRALEFVEKPDLATAQHYLSTGRYYWNSGMFYFTVDAALQAFKNHIPEVVEAAERSRSGRKIVNDATWFDPPVFELQPDFSTDYAAMERASNVTLVPARFSWSDVGSWPSMAQAHAADNSGNTFEAGEEDTCIALAKSDTHIHYDSHAGKVVDVIGVHNLVIVDTSDALLVLHKSAAQKVRQVVEILKECLHESVLLPFMAHRLWESYITLKEDCGYKVKRIGIKPRHALSLQYYRHRHRHRMEPWIVVQGTGLVQIGDSKYQMMLGQYRYIALNENHHLTNNGPDDMTLIEVQCGHYLHEDDIVRLADVYGRV